MPANRLRCHQQTEAMTSSLNTRPTDEELAVDFHWTPYTRWGVSGFNGYGVTGEDFT